MFETIIAGFWIAVWIGGIIVASWGAIRLRKWAENKQLQEAVEANMRQQLKVAEYERAAARKIARERGWDK